MEDNAALAEDGVFLPIILAILFAFSEATSNDGGAIP